MPRQAQPLSAFVVAGLLSLPFLALFWIWAAASTAESLTISALFILFLLLGAPFLGALLKGCLDPVEPIYLWVIVFGGLYFFKPLYYSLFNVTHYFSEETLQYGIAVAYLGLSAFYLGYYLPFGRTIASSLPRFQQPISRSRLRRIAWFFVLIGVFAYGSLIGATGGLGNFLSSPRGFPTAFRESVWASYLLTPVWFILPAFLILYHDNLTQPGKTRRWLLWVSVGLPFLILLLFRGERKVIYLVLGVLVLRYLAAKPLSYVKTGIILISTLLLVSVLPAYRGVHLGSDLQQLETPFLEAVHYGALEGSEGQEELHSYLAVLDLFPDQIDYDYGAEYYALFISWIPRAWWPSKPTLMSPRWEEYLSQSGINSGGATTLLGDLYMVLGLSTVFVGMMCLGVFWKAIYQYYLLSRTNPFQQILLALSFPLIFLTVAQGIQSFIFYF